LKNIRKSIRGKLDEEIKELIKVNRKIGKGRNRVIYDLENGYVLKVVRSKTGIKHNKRELQMYFTSSSSIRKHLAQIIDYDKLWLVMEKYDRKFPRSKKYKKKLKKLESKFRKKEIDPIDMFDKRKKTKRKNLRINKNGRIIIIDYGAFRMKR